MQVSLGGACLSTVTYQPNLKSEGSKLPFAFDVSAAPAEPHPWPQQLPEIELPLLESPFATLLSRSGCPKVRDG